MRHNHKTQAISRFLNHVYKQGLLLGLLAASLSAAGCGDTHTVTNDFNPNPNGNTPVPVAAVHVTDFVSSSILSVVSNLGAVAPEDIFVNILDPLPHTDTAMRTFGDLLYVINRLGRDSIQIVDPQDNFKTDFRPAPGPTLRISSSSITTRPMSLFTIRKMVPMPTIYWSSIRVPAPYSIRST